MNFRTISFALFLAVGSLGCGDDDGTADTGTADTGTADTGTSADAAGDASAGNALGTPCDTANPTCPAGHTCAVFPLMGGSMTLGYCTPMCMDNSDCSDGYTGPGTASCFAMGQCAITCMMPNGTDGVCPTGLTCLPTGGPTNACGVPM